METKDCHSVSTNQNSEAQPSKIKSNNYEKMKAILLLLSASMGIGCLGISSSIAQLGLLIWIPTILSVCAFYYLSYYVILKLTDHFKVFTVSQLGNKIIPSHSWIVDFIFVATNLAGYLACLITVNENFPILMRLFSFSSNLFTVLQTSNVIWIYISTALTIFVVLNIKPQNLHSVTVISVFSSVCLIGFVLYGLSYRTEPINISEVVTRMDTQNVFHIFMFLGFSFLCQQNLMTLGQASNLRSFEETMSAVNIFTVCILAIYMIVGLVGYLTFYDKPALAHSNILQMYSSSGAFYAITLLIVNLNIQVGNAVMLYPIRDIIMDYIYGPKPKYVVNIINKKHNQQPVSNFFRNNRFKGDLKKPMMQNENTTNSLKLESKIHNSIYIDELNVGSSINSNNKITTMINNSDDSIAIIDKCDVKSIKSTVNECNDQHQRTPKTRMKYLQNKKKKNKSDQITIAENYSVKSVKFDDDRFYEDLIEKDNLIFEKYASLEKTIGFSLIVLMGLIAHVLVLLNVKFYDAVDFVSKVFFPILFFYLPLAAYIKIFKNYWMMIPLIIFLSINIIVFLY